MWHRLYHLASRCLARGAVTAPCRGGSDLELGGDLGPGVFLVPGTSDRTRDADAQLSEEADHGVKFSQAVPEHHGRAQQGELFDGFLKDGFALLVNERMVGARKCPWAVLESGVSIRTVRRRDHACSSLLEDLGW
jgi:hypothetical protein